MDALDSPWSRSERLRSQMAGDRSLYGRAAMSRKMPSIGTPIAWGFSTSFGASIMSIPGLVLLVLLILLLFGAAPAWPHSRSWGYAPSGGIGLILVIVLILVLLQRI